MKKRASLFAALVLAVALIGTNVAVAHAEICSCRSSA